MSGKLAPGQRIVLGEMADQLGMSLTPVWLRRATPLDGVGIGLKIDTAFIADHPLIDGPCYV